MLLMSTSAQSFVITNVIRIMQIMELVGSFKIVAMWSAASRLIGFPSSEGNRFVNANFWG